jgi:hypothetical protein
MPRTDDARRHWRLLAMWPARDRACWQQSTAPCGDLQIPTYGQSLRRASLASTERAYGRYLNYLDGCGSLDPEAEPASRVTPVLMTGFIRHLQALGYSRQTVIDLIAGLRCAMRILAPEVDTRWIWRPNGTRFASHILGRRKTFDVPNTADLLDWGLRLMARRDHLGLRHSLTAMRDGLIISLLALRPMRRRTIAGLRLGQHLVRESAGWRICLAPEDVKNRRAHEFFVPEDLNPKVDQYLKDVRPRLLRGAEHDAVWIASFGRPMALTAVGLMIRCRARREFGIGFGPHRFRHALGTTAPILDPVNPGTAAAVLAIGQHTVEEHYNRSENHVAAADHHNALAAERNSLEPLARRLFERGV